MSSTVAGLEPIGTKGDDPGPLPATSLGMKPLIKQPIVQDALAAAVLTGASLVGVVASLHVDLPEGGGDVALRGLDALGIALIILQTTPLVWRRRAPVLVLSVTATALIIFARLGYFRSFASAGFLIALYTVAAYRERRTSIPAGVAGGFVVLLILFMGQERVEPDAIFAEGLIIGAAWFLGDGLRIRQGRVVQLEDRATRLEREREERAQQAVAEERRVIARELHDVIAHHVSVTVAQAGAAQRIFATQPDEALAALGTIERVGREALAEMRRLMGFLRTEADRPPALSPQPGMNHLEPLVAQVREAGVPVSLRIDGTPRPLPAGLNLIAFRIVQEALTNVLKHAGPATAEVVVRYGDDRLDLTITDEAIGSATPDEDGSRPRYGHLGMRERVALFGGELRVGPRPDGGYEVIASLPLEPETVR